MKLAKDESLDDEIRAAIGRVLAAHGKPAKEFLGVVAFRKGDSETENEVVSFQTEGKKTTPSEDKKFVTRRAWMIGNSIATQWAVAAAIIRFLESADSGSGMAFLDEVKGAMKDNLPPGVEMLPDGVTLR